MNDADVIVKIINKLDELKSTYEDMEFMNDLHIIDSMIKDMRFFDKNVIDHIKEKYDKELGWLLSLEINLRSYQRSNYVYNPINDLYSTRYSMIRVGIKRVLEKKGKKLLEDDLINNDNSNLYNKFIDKINEK